jgi:hypothetical protein
MSDIEDGFENFAAVVFAAAEDHDFAYCQTTSNAKEQKSGCMDVIKQFYAEIYGKKNQPKLAPKLNLAGSKLFERRAKAAAAKVEAASVCSS